MAAIQASHPKLGRGASDGALRAPAGAGEEVLTPIMDEVYALLYEGQGTQTGGAGFDFPRVQGGGLKLEFKLQLVLRESE